MYRRYGPKDYEKLIKELKKEGFNKPVDGKKIKKDINRRDRHFTGENTDSGAETPSGALHRESATTDRS